MKARVWGIMLSLIIIATPAMAEFFRYIDERGNVRYTDDINQVPGEQRNRIRSYIESSSNAESDAPQPAPAGKSAPAAAPAERLQAEAGQPADDGGANLDQMRTRLEGLKKEVDDELTALQKEQEEIRNIKPATGNREEMIAYDARIKGFNKRVADLNKKSEELTRQVDAYNARVAEANANIAAKQKK
jgi:uncharacterized protein YukE